MTGFIVTAIVGTVIWTVLCLRAWRGVETPASQRQAINNADYQAGLTRIHAAQVAGELDAAQVEQETRRLQQQLILAAQAESGEPDKPWAHALGGVAKMAVLVLPLSLATLVFVVTEGESHWPGSAPPPSATDVQGMVEQLAQRLEQNPEDTQGWLMLGRSYMVMQRYAQAAQALQQANTRMQPPIPAAQLAEAEALALAGDAAFAQRGRQLLEEVLQGEPENVRALWYLGLAAQVAGDTATAQEAFARLRTQPDLPPEVARALDQLSDVAPHPSSAAPVSAPESVNIPEISLTIELDESLQNQAWPSQTLFVVAKRPDGPPMPLAARKLQTQDFPLTLTLGPDHILRPGNAWTAQDSLLITARLSASGQALAGSGDWQGQELWTAQRSSPVNIKLDAVLP